MPNVFGLQLDGYKMDIVTSIHRKCIFTSTKHIKEKLLPQLCLFVARK